MDARKRYITIFSVAAFVIIIIALIPNLHFAGNLAGFLVRQSIHGEGYSDDELMITDGYKLIYINNEQIPLYHETENTNKGEMGEFIAGKRVIQYAYNDAYIALKDNDTWESMNYYCIDVKKQKNVLETKDISALESYIKMNYKVKKVLWIDTLEDD